MPERSSTFRVLALDGGGIKGVFAAAAIAAWEKSTKLSVRDHFDLISGTSTGGILAIGLGLGMSGAELLEFYKRSGPRIFPSTGFRRRWGRTIRQILRPKHCLDDLRRELYTAFGDKLFGDSKNRLLIPAYDTVRGRIYLFKTEHDPRNQYDKDIPAVDVALATAAAPTYFRAARIAQHEGAGYVDGGVWANSPALSAVVEASAILGKSLQEIDVLSIGTTYAPSSTMDLSGAGLLGWGTRVIDLIMNAQVEASWNQARLLVGADRFLRVDCLTKPREYALDRSEGVEALAAIGRSRAVEKDILASVQKRFLNGVMAPPFPG